MFKFAIYTNINTQELLKKLDNFEKFLTSKNNVKDQNAPNIVFVFGGDGCLLDSIDKFQDIDCSYFLINCGNLGFYREIEIGEIEIFFKEFDYESLTYEVHNFLEISDNFKNKSYGVNEIMIAAGIKTLDIDVSINDKHFMTSKGNGICIATPFGSSGYNHSLGGPLMIDTNGLILSLLAPIQNAKIHPAIHSLVLTNKDILKLKVTSFYDYEVAADMKILTNLKGNEYTIQRSEKTFKLAHIKSVDKYQRIKRAFID
jgi:NAD+ kinase